MITDSIQPRKQRKALFQSRISSLKKNVSVHYSKELRAKHKKRSAAVKKADKVRVIRGDHKKREGKVIDVDVKAGKIYVEGIINKKQGGKEIPAAIEPSNCILIEWAVPRKGKRMVRKAGGTKLGK